MVLARNALFALCISVIPALLPVVGLKLLNLGASNLGLLFTSMGAGSVVAAVVIIPRLRARYSPNTLTILANWLVLQVYVSMAVVRQMELLFLIAVLAGVGWTVSASELWVAAQRAMPGWARGRMNASVIMVSQGAIALGGLVWGCAAATVGVRCALLGAVILLVVNLLLTNALSIDFTGPMNSDPAPVTNLSHKTIQTL